MVETTLIILGLVGILGMTWLFPLLGRVFWALSKSSRSRRSDPKLWMAPLKIAVLIPAHQEENSIARTVRSIRAAASSARVSLELSIHVGADGCTDRTAEIASSEGAVVHRFAQQGKWKTIQALAALCGEADWVIFVDAGIEWPAHFFKAAWGHLHDPELIAIAPTYRVGDGGAVESLLWKVERHFKLIETAAGGPISIHGATVCYRRPELLAAFAALSSAQWLNDDVVIPLTLRALNPSRRILYSTEIFALDRLRGAAPQPELRRRKRMMMGNIQWIRQALFGQTGAHGVVSILAFRRIFRLLWAYWGLAFATGLLFALVPTELAWRLLETALALIALHSIWSRKRMVRAQGGLAKLMDAAIASLMAPYYLVSTSSQPGRTLWK